MKKINIILITILIILLSSVCNAYANIVFPAIAHQFMVSIVVPSYWSMILAILILIIESLFISKLFRLNFIFSFILSFFINLISSVSGVFITNFFSDGIFAYKNMKLGTYLGMIPGYVLTVILEGLLLFLISLLIKIKIRLFNCIKTSIIMNLFSYLILLAGILIADFATKGKVFNTY